MKVFTQFLIKTSLMVIAVMLTTVSYGAVFTATASGDFSSSATWSGGIIPPAILTSDVILIPAGITVTLDQDLTVNGALAQLDVTGSLITNDSASLVMVQGTLSGIGTISLNTIDLKAGTTFLFAGEMNVKYLNVDATFASTADMAIEKTLALQSGDMSLTTGGSLSLSPDARLMFSGGSLTVGTGGYADLSTDYGVRYEGNSFTSGVELTGTGLNDLEVAMNPGSTLTLSSDATVAGKLELNSGTLALADRDLTINGDVTSTTGTILSTSLSDITINALSSTTGALSFEAGSALKDLIINLPSEYAAKIEGYLSLYGNLVLDSGILKMDDAAVNIYGDVSGTGMLSTTQLTNLSILTSSELSTSLRFDNTGQVLNSLTVAVGTDNELTLGSDLTVKGELALTDGSILKLNSNSLTLDSESSITGTGKLSVDEYSALTINSTTGLDALKMDGTIGDLAINTDASSTVNLTSDARVSGMLTLQSGTMMLNDYDLTVMGDIATSGEGKIYTTTSSDVTFSSGTSGALVFGDGSVVKTMTVDAGTDYTAKISGEVTIDSLLKLTSGVMFMSDASVTIKGDIVGTGMLSSTAADMTITSTTTLSEPLRFTADANTLNSLTIAVGENNKVSLGSDLTVDGMLSLTDGSALDISGRTLVLDSESNLTGTGFIKVDSTSSLMINATTDIASLKMDGTIGDFTINTTDASVTLTSDARIDGTLTMASGELILNKNDLSIYGAISTTGTGTLSTTAESDIKIETQTAPAGALRFSTTANIVGDMTVKIADNGIATVDSDMTIDKNLYLQSGILDINDQTLFMSSGSTVIGGSMTSYVKTDAGGSIEIDITECDSFMFYPTGTITSFAPTYISLKCGSEMGKVQVGLASDVYAQGSAGTDLSLTESMVDATWDITSTISTGLDMDLKVVWPSTIEVNNFDRTDAFISHYTNGEWDSSARLAATTEANGMFSLERTSITSLSPFAVFDVNTITATDDVTGDILLKVFPNPAVDNLIIQSISTVDPLNMDIYNSTGQLMGQYKLTEPNSTVSVKDLMNGNYFLRFYNKDLNSTIQFTKI